MKLRLIPFLTVLLLLVLTACGTKEFENTPTMGLPNPCTVYGTFAEAQSAAGFDLTAPEAIGTRRVTGISVFKTDGKMLQLVYGTDNDTVTIRKAALGAGGVQDISGMYITYESTETAQCGDLTLTLKGNGDLIFVAVWASDNFNYAILSDAGLTCEEVLQLAEKIV